MPVFASENRKKQKMSGAIPPRLMPPQIINQTKIPHRLSGTGSVIKRIRR
jgi:hypothetical protein